MRFEDCPPVKEKPTKETGRMGDRSRVRRGRRGPISRQVGSLSSATPKIKETLENAVRWQTSGHC